MNYEILFITLNNANVKYVICGGLAVNLHGVPRMTADIDIILELEKDNLQKFSQCVLDFKYQIQQPVDLIEMANEAVRKDIIKSKNLVALSYYNFDHNYLALDVLINFPIPFLELWKNKVIRVEGDLSLPIVSIDDLIKLKEYANRIQDQQDIFFLSKIKNGNS